jgi:hypothetical protein
MENENKKFQVLVHRGTQAYESTYARDLTKRDAERMAETAKLYGYHDARVAKMEPRR